VFLITLNVLLKIINVLTFFDINETNARIGFFCTKIINVILKTKKLYLKIFKNNIIVKLKIENVFCYS